MLITKGEVSFGGQQELLKWSVIPGFAVVILTISLIYSGPCLKISLGEKNNPLRVMQEVRDDRGEKQSSQNKPGFQVQTFKFLLH